MRTRWMTVMAVGIVAVALGIGMGAICGPAALTGRPVATTPA
jgi:hypothetical protein